MRCIAVSDVEVFLLSVCSITKSNVLYKADAGRQYGFVYPPQVGVFLTSGNRLNGYRSKLNELKSDCRITFFL